MHNRPLPATADLPPIILILDSDPDTRDLYETALKMGGMWASSVANPDEAFTFAEDIRPDAILADIETGGPARGRTLAERLRSNERTAGIPILGITTSAPVDPSTPEGLFAAVLQKPVELPALVERIREAITRGAELRARGDRARAKVPDLLERSEHLLERSVSHTEHRGLAPPGAPRPCPRCSTELLWVERRQVMGVVFDYYRPCRGGCGLFCYDHVQRAFVTLIG